MAVVVDRHFVIMHHLADVRLPLNEDEASLYSVDISLELYSSGSNDAIKAESLILFRHTFSVFLSPSIV